MSFESQASQEGEKETAVKVLDELIERGEQYVASNEASLGHVMSLVERLKSQFDKTLSLGADIDDEKMTKTAQLIDWLNKREQELS